jgi:phage terminase small subunit
MSLTPQQERFCAEFLIDLNATAAYGRAYPGTKPAAARANAARLLAKDSVQRRLAELQAARAERCQVTQDRVLLELARIGLYDARTLYRPDGSMKPPAEWDDATAAAIAGVEVDEAWEPAAGEGAAEEGREPQPHGGELKRSRAKLVLSRTLKVKRFDKGKALELLCRHLGMLNDKLAVSAPPGSGLDITRLPDAIKRTLLDALRAAAAPRPGGGGPGGPAG